MRSTFFGIEIGKTGLTVSQLGLDLTGHNIANVDTVGYTRQRIVQTAYDPPSSIGRALPMEQARIGGGARVKILDQIRSAYLDKRYRNETTTNSYWSKRTEGLSYLQSFFDNVAEETSINTTLGSFFEAVKTVADDPVEGAQRKLLQTAADDLVQHLNTTYAGLIELQESSNLSVRTTVEEINSIAEEFTELNKAIYSFEITGHLANDLKDKRNLLLDELSTLVDIEYREVSDDYNTTIMEVSIGGKTLVSHDKSWKLGVREGANTIAGEAEVDIPVWLDSSGKPLETTDPNSGAQVLDEFGNPVFGDPVLDENGDPVLDENNDPVLQKKYYADLKLKGGELKAFMDLRDNKGVNLPGIPRSVEMLDYLAKAIVQEVNRVHREGWTDPPVGDSETGVDFFWSGGDDGLDAVTAKTFRLSDEVAESEFNIACSSAEIGKPGDSGELERGNNENMNKLYNVFDTLRNIVVGTETIGTLASYATSIRTSVATTLSTCKGQLDNSNILTLAAENQRVSIAGVSLDEEMTSLVKYQHAYTGAARVITAMDEALDKLINGTGRVGL